MSESEQKIKVGVYGASGYAGQDAVEILTQAPLCRGRVRHVEHLRRAGRPVHAT